MLPVQAHTPFAWEVAPGTPTRASKVEFDGSGGNPATLEAPFGQLTVYVVDRRVVARHYVFPESPQGATQGQLRLYPRAVGGSGPDRRTDDDRRQARLGGARVQDGERAGDAAAG